MRLKRRVSPRIDLVCCLLQLVKAGHSSSNLMQTSLKRKYSESVSVWHVGKFSEFVSV